MDLGIKYFIVLLFSQFNLIGFDFNSFVRLISFKLILFYFIDTMKMMGNTK